MPTFPSYGGPPLPAVLNPLNPLHYWMLADWIFFKPSRLKQYLYRAAPDLYFQRGRRALAASARLPAYRNLLLMAPLLTLLLFASVAWAASAAQATDVRWVGVALAVAVGVAVGVAFGVAFGVARGVAGGVALGVALGVVFGVAGGVVFGVAWGVAVGVAGGVAGGVVFGVVFGVVVGVAVGVALGVAWGVGVLRGVFYVLQIGPALWHISSRGAPARRLARHPALGDELAVLPFPGLGRLLAHTLAEDFPAALQATRALLRNPFQRWAVARGFTHFLERAPDPLAALYAALSDARMEEYPVEPSENLDAKAWPAARAVWLGELAGDFVDASGDRSRTSEQIAWRVTRALRGPAHPQIAPLARCLLHLITKSAQEQTIAPAPVEAAAAAVRGLPHGDEVALSLVALAWLAVVEDLAGVAAGQEALAWLDTLAKAPLRPQVLEALRGMGDIAAEISRFRQATSPATQAHALNRAVGMLDELARYVEEINLPERTLLRLVVRRWQSLVAEAAGRLGERALREMEPSARRAPGGERRAALWSRPAGPFSNPYKTGDPVAPPLFVGRDDILNRIQGVWTQKASPDSVIVYGHRRMGKSSILRNLAACAPPDSLPVYADLKGETAFAAGTHYLLRGLADAVVWAARNHHLPLAEPDAAEYAAPAEAAPALRRLLHRALAELPERACLILALDEFEALDAAVQAGKIGRDIYHYLRSLSQEPRIVLVFAGLHTLDEMSRDYQAAFFDSYVNVRVSYLPPEAAGRLIARPTPDFRLDYHPQVIERVVHATHGQPLLVQRICQELVNQVNHELFDLERERQARVLPQDLEAVLSDDFVRSETRYFDGIWSDQVAGRAAVEAALRALAAGPATPEEIAQATGLPAAEVAAALDYLQVRDLAAAGAAGRYDLLVPLMRRWLRLRGTQS